MRVVGHCPQKQSFEGSQLAVSEGNLRAVIFDWIRLQTLPVTSRDNKMKFRDNKFLGEGKSRVNTRCVG